MKRFIILSLLFTFFVFGCSKGGDEAGFKKGAPAYKLAKELSSILPLLDPEKNAVLISTNTFEVTTGEIIQSILSFMGKRTDQLKNFDAEGLKKIIDENAMQLAERKLLLGEAEKAKSSVSSEEFDKTMNFQYDRSGGKENFLKMLDENGIDIEHVKESIKKDLLIKNYVEGVLASKIMVSEEEIQKIYKEDKTASVRHILLFTQEKNDLEKKEILKKMEDILARAKKGEDFAELAKKYTDDPGSKKNGGLYENFGRGQMVKPFEDAAFSIPIGKISDIVETRYGYHILKVIDRKKEARLLDEVRSEIEGQIKQARKSDAYKTFVDKLKEKASLKINDRIMD
ncbi:MAG: peptidylprolyl isomerase [Candidatus Aminicenantes bacterium]|nr:peptidylprolyl isomerase [Candidatus Aminicenantes bacterium]